jgi:hypothetical protein
LDLCLEPWAKPGQPIAAHPSQLFCFPTFCPPQSRCLAQKALKFFDWGAVTVVRALEPGQEVIRKCVRESNAALGVLGLAGIAHVRVAVRFLETIAMRHTQLRSEESSVFAQDADDTPLNFHFGGGQDDGLHLGIRRLEANLSAGFPVEPLERCFIAADQRDHNFALIGNL